MRRLLNPAEFDELYTQYEQRLRAFQNEPNWGNAQLVFMTAYALAPVALREKAVPASEAKTFAKTVREFDRRRVPKDLQGWFKKNSRPLLQLLQTNKWPDKGTHAQQTIRVDDLVVHNQTGQDVSANLKMLETVVTLMRESGVPRIEETIYGDVLLVGNVVKNHNTMARYVMARDLIEIMVVKRFETKFLQATIHEFGHRYWSKFVPQPTKSQWARWHLQIHNDATDAFQYRTPKIGDVLAYTAGGPKHVVAISVHPRHGQILTIEGGGSIKLDNYWNVERRNAIMAAYPTLYAAKNSEEHFCEALALFCLGELAPKHAESFAEIFEVPRQATMPAPSDSPVSARAPGERGQISMFNPARSLARRIADL